MRENNKFVIGIGKKQTSNAFVSVCNVFKFTDDFMYNIEGKTYISVEKKKETINAPQKGISSLINLLSEAVNNKAQNNQKTLLNKVVSEIALLHLKPMDIVTI